MIETDYKLKMVTYPEFIYVKCLHGDTLLLYETIWLYHS